MHKEISLIDTVKGNKFVLIIDGGEFMRKNFIIAWIFLLILFLFQNTVTAQNWMNKLIPLQTNIDQIEQILTAKPFNAKVLKEPKSEDRYIFYLKEGALAIYFSLGRCVDGRFGKFELDKGVIIQASFIPKKWRKISYYEKNVVSLKRDTSAAPTYISYENVKKGIDYTVQQGKVSEITFFGPENLSLTRCKD